MRKETVSVAKFKSSLSRYISKAQRGQTIEITSHRRPVARVTGIPEGLPHGISTLVAENKLALGDGKPLNLAKPVKLSGAAPLVSEMVMEDRGPR